MSDNQQGSNPGRFISQKTAKKMLDAYFDYREELQKNNNVPWDPKTNHYAYAFGLEQMKELMSQIETYNEQNPKNPVEGLRIYNTRTLPPQAPGDDVYIIPYTADKKNIMAVDNFHDNNGEEITELSDDEGMALNWPKFCPPKCSDN